MGTAVGRVLTCVFLLFLYRLIVYILCNKSKFKDIIYGSMSAKDILAAIDFKWIFFAKAKTQKPGNIDTYVRADAQVIKCRESIYEFTDERGDLQKTVTYIMKIKYYVGTQSVTAELESDHYDKTIEVCYNTDDPHEVYCADDEAFRSKTANEKVEEGLSSLWGVIGYVFAAVYVFYPLLKLIGIF